MTSPACAHVFSFVAANEARKAHEAFLFFFFARYADLVRVDHNNEVTGIDVWSEDRFLFAAQKPRRLHRDVTQHLIFGIDQPPFAVDLIGFGGKRLHQRLEKGTEATGRAGHCQPGESAGVVVLKVLSRNYNAPSYFISLRSYLFSSNRLG